MQHYVGLDVSLKQTAVCVVDQTGKIKREAMVASDPDAITQFLAAHSPDAVRIGLETGATSTWALDRARKRGLPVICIDARHAKAALKMQINKSDRNDAAGIARIRQCEWYRRGTRQGPRRPWLLRCLKGQNALHTLIRQSHQAPSCEGYPEPERGENSGPARKFTEAALQ
jgi:transposase